MVSIVLVLFYLPFFLFFFSFFLNYKLQNNNKLIDLNECSTNNGECSVNAICSNTIGNFTCACKAGYSGDGFICDGKKKLVTKRK